MENEFDQLLGRIRRYRHMRGWNITRFAKEAGVPRSVVAQMDHPEWSPSASTLRAIADMMARPVENEGARQAA